MRAGNNLNQLSRWANTERRYPAKDEAAAAYEQIRAQVDPDPSETRLKYSNKVGPGSRRSVLGKLMDLRGISVKEMAGRCGRAMSTINMVRSGGLGDWC